MRRRCSMIFARCSRTVRRSLPSARAMPWFVRLPARISRKTRRVADDSSRDSKIESSTGVVGVGVGAGAAVTSSFHAAFRDLRRSSIILRLATARQKPRGSSMRSCCLARWTRAIRASWIASSMKGLLRQRRRSLWRRNSTRRCVAASISPSVGSSFDCTPRLLAGNQRRETSPGCEDLSRSRLVGSWAVPAVTPRAARQPRPRSPQGTRTPSRRSSAASRNRGRPTMAVWSPPSMRVKSAMPRPSTL